MARVKVQVKLFAKGDNSFKLGINFTRVKIVAFSSSIEDAGWTVM